MREALSNLLVETAKEDERFLVLSGDHGYALFDALRAQRPSQFVNVGVAEQNMIGVASGLTKVGFRPCVYGLASFVPIRVLEQIKLDLCHAKAPVVLLGDGAGLVYSTLGVSHQSGEDIACLRPLPNISIYSPCDEWELRSCWREARRLDHPAYIRIGKADRPAVHASPLADTEPAWTQRSSAATCGALLVATGAMTSVATEVAQSLDFDCISVPRLKPLAPSLAALAMHYRRTIVLEEHVAAGGLFSSLIELLADAGGTETVCTVSHVGLRSHFTESAGCYDHALAEHGLTRASIRSAVERLSPTNASAPKKTTIA
jgi:transketolase